MHIGISSFAGQTLPFENKLQHEIIRDSISQAQEADAVGLDSIWISEHHFLESGYLGSALPFAAALGTATRNIAVGVFAIGPRYEPIQMAEDAVFIDQLTGGRFNLALVLGYRDIEYRGFGIERSERTSRLEELAILLRQSWGHGIVSFQGRHFQRAGFEVFPKPVRATGIRLLMGGHHPRAIDRCARLADALVMDGGTDSDTFRAEGHNRDIYQRVEAMLSAYKAALARHGKVKEPVPFYMTIGGFISEDGADAAWETVKEAYMYTRRIYGEWYGIPAAQISKWYPNQMSPEETRLRRGELWLGTPDELVPRFERLRQIVGSGLHVIFRTKYAGVPHDRTLESIRLLGKVRDYLK